MLAADEERGSGRSNCGMSERARAVPAEGNAWQAAAAGASQNDAAQGEARERRSQPGHHHGQPEAQQQQQPSWTAYVATAARWMLIYWVITSFFGSSNKNKLFPVMTNPNASADPPEAALSRVTAAAPIWRFGTPMALSVYLSESDAPVSFADSARIWHQPNIKLGDWEDERRNQVRISLSRAVNADNATLWAHIYLTKDGKSPDPTSFNFSGDDMVYVKAPLINLRPKAKAVAFKKLVGGSDSQSEEKPVEDDTVIGRALPGELVPFLVRNFTINIVTAEETIPMQQVIPQIRELVPLDKRSMDLQKGIALYRPPVYVNEFWLLEENLVQVNSSLKTADLQLYLYPLSILKFQVYVQMHDQMSKQAEVMGAAGQMDEMKRMILETNPWLLGLTFVVSILHSIFDFLAFKSDINFWKGKKDITGLSVRSMLLDLFMQTVVFLYLLDNNANTSWVILFSAGIGLVIEAWKVKKAMNYVVIPAPPGSWVPYRVKIEDKVSYVKSQTKEYDEEAFRYLSYVAYPLMAGYAVYSLLYEKHKSWYSYVLNTVVGFCYMFGFLRMTPQLFVNYKLKSVAHMPWRTMVYKSLNTFIDDLFAFIIKAPLLHRIACFRDDVVFLVYLYQKWIYRVDPTRANEFGQVGVPDEEERATDASPEAATTTESKKEK